MRWQINQAQPLWELETVKSPQSVSPVTFGLDAASPVFQMDSIQAYEANSTIEIL